MTFTIDQIRNYLTRQDSFGDALYNLSEENILKADKIANKKIYQPADAGTGDSCFSFEVYHSKERAQEDYPDSEILEYNLGDIEDPAFVDEEE